MTRLTTRTGQGTLQDEDVLVGQTFLSDINGAVVVAGVQGEALAGDIPGGKGRFGIAVAGTAGRATSREGGVAVAGDDGYANCGANGVAIVTKPLAPAQPVEERGYATGGDGSFAIVQRGGGYASVTGGAIAYGGQGGRVRGEAGSLLILLHRINETDRGFVVGQVLPLQHPGDIAVPGAHPLDPKVWYRLDAQGRFVRA